MLVASLDTRWEKSRRCFVFFSESILQGGFASAKSWAALEEWEPAGQICLICQHWLCNILSSSLQACGGSIQTSVNALSDDVLGRCELFEETQIGGDR